MIKEPTLRPETRYCQWPGSLNTDIELKKKIMAYVREEEIGSSR
jgi:hypothetical protein